MAGDGRYSSFSDRSIRWSSVHWSEGHQIRTVERNLWFLRHVLPSRRRRSRSLTGCFYPSPPPLHHLCPLPLQENPLIHSLCLWIFHSQLILISFLVLLWWSVEVNLCIFFNSSSVVLFSLILYNCVFSLFVNRFFS